MQLTMPLRAVPRLAPLLLLIALLLAAALAVVWIGSRPRLPDPFGPAANGQGRVPVERPGLRREPGRLESDPADVRRRSAATPIWSRDGTKFAYGLISPGHSDTRRVGTATSSSPTPTVRTRSRSIGIAKDIQPCQVVAGRPMAGLFANGRSLYDQIFIAATDGSSPPVRIGNPRPSTGRRSSPRMARRSCTSSVRTATGSG